MMLVMQLPSINSGSIFMTRQILLRVTESNIPKYHFDLVGFQQIMDFEKEDLFVGRFLLMQTWLCC
jgi:hypothetical protein